MNLIFLPQFDPNLVAFEALGFEFALRWYAIAYVLGFVVAWQWFIRMIRYPALWPGERPPAGKDLPDRLLTWIIIGVIAGGRLGYVLFYNPAYFLDNPLQIVAIWQGGMSFHGGLAGLVVATYVFCRLNGLHVPSISDAIAVVAMPGLFFGRLANFINAELWGKPTDLPWAVVFPAGGGSVCPPDWPGICARHPSQLYEAVLEGVVLCALLAYLAYRRRWMHRPGQVAGLFFAGYGIVRFMVEFVREPDEQFVSDVNPLGFALQFGDVSGLTMGQLLSVPMIVAGLLVIWLARWRQLWTPGKSETGTS